MSALSSLILAAAASSAVLAPSTTRAVSQDAGPVTFAEHVAPIVFGNCTECHRPGEAAPFTFESYQDVKKRGRMIATVVESGYMPPWHPVDGHGAFLGQRGLSEAEIETLAQWVDDGMPEGDASRTPAVPEFPSGWQLGEPDLVLEMDEIYEVPASGPDIYRNFCLPIDLPDDRWVTAIEVRPSARTVVHHVLFFHDDSGTARQLDEADPVPGFDGMGFRRSGSLGGWAVGASPYVLPGGLAMPLPKGADLVLQTHFHPSGKPESERTRIGIHLNEEPPERRIVGIQLPPQYAAFAGLDVPAGEAAFTLRDSMQVPVDTELVTVGAHAHYIGKQMRSWAVLPDGNELPLFYIDDWDFNWQGRYVYEEPITLPAGSVIEVELVYDNSTENPRNPFHPPQRITWGLESTDEMGAITFVGVAADIADADELSRAVRAKFSDARRNRRRVSVDWRTRVMRLDENGDGKISADEIPDAYRQGLERIDRNGDGTLDADELALLDRVSGGRGRQSDDGGAPDGGAPDGGSDG